ncbi:MAG: DUF2750 domain-containing protein [Gammaproteobacteria bacterium]|nr:DUF2750 domain-containing protein [Gammaproteobacteria bacterium]
MWSHVFFIFEVFVSSIDAVHEAALRQFVKAVRQSGQIWGLESANGWALCEASQAPGTNVMPFWSSESAAAAHGVDEWGEYTATAIDLDEFLEHWTLGLAGDGMLAGVDWDESLEGVELEAEVLEEWLLGER